MKVLIDKEVEKLIFSKFRSDSKEILKDIKNYSLNPSKGKRVGIVNNFEVWQIKTAKGKLRLLFARYMNIEYVMLEDKFRDVSRLVKIARKNKTKEQNKFIDEILEMLRKNGLDF